MYETQHTYSFLSLFYLTVFSYPGFIFITFIKFVFIGYRFVKTRRREESDSYLLTAIPPFLRLLI